MVATWISLQWPVRQNELVSGVIDQMIIQDNNQQMDQSLVAASELTASCFPLEEHRWGVDSQPAGQPRSSAHDRSCWTQMSHEVSVLLQPCVGVSSASHHAPLATSWLDSLVLPYFLSAGWEQKYLWASSKLMSVWLKPWRWPVSTGEGPVVGGFSVQSWCRGYHRHLNLKE